MHPFVLPVKSPESFSPSSSSLTKNLSTVGLTSPDGQNLEGASPVKPRALTFTSPPQQPLQDITNLQKKRERGIKEISKSSMTPLRRSRSQSSSPPYHKQTSPRIRNPASTRPHATSLFPVLPSISSPQGPSASGSPSPLQKSLPSPSTAPASVSPDSQSAPLSPLFPRVPSPSFSSQLSPPTPPSTVHEVLSPLYPKEKVTSPESEEKPKRPSLSLSIMTDVDDSTSASTHFEDTKDEDTPTFLSGSSSNPVSPRSMRGLPPVRVSTITRPQSTTAMESRRNVFDFGLSDEEPMTADEEWNQTRSLQRSHSVSGQFSAAAEEADSISSQMDSLESSSGLLSSVPSGSGCGIRLITHDTMAQLIRGELRHQIDNYIIVDCRYDYEYNGGHITNAVNIMCKQHIERFYQDNRHIKGKVAVIFHCEFSKHRGPNSSRFFRQLDRSANEYPSLTFPELYVLEGGYRIFYQHYAEHCTPNGYVSMWDPKYSKECKDRHREFRKSWASKNSRRGASARHNRPDPTSRLGIPAPAPLRRSLTQAGRGRERQLSVIIDNSPQRELREDQEKGDTESPEEGLPTIPSPKRSSTKRRPMVRGFTLPLDKPSPSPPSFPLGEISTTLPSSTPRDIVKATSPLAGLADLRIDSGSGTSSSSFHFPSFPSFSLVDTEMPESDELFQPALHKSSSFSLFDTSTRRQPARTDPMTTRRLASPSKLIPSSASAVVSATTTPVATPRGLLPAGQFLTFSRQ